MGANPPWALERLWKAAVMAFPWEVCASTVLSWSSLWHFLLWEITLFVGSSLIDFNVSPNGTKLLWKLFILNKNLYRLVEVVEEREKILHSVFIISVRLISTEPSNYGSLKPHCYWLSLLCQTCLHLLILEMFWNIPNICTLKEEET